MDFITIGKRGGKKTLENIGKWTLKAESHHINTNRDVKKKSKHWIHESHSLQTYKKEKQTTNEWTTKQTCSVHMNAQRPNAGMWFEIWYLFLISPSSSSSSIFQFIWYCWQKFKKYVPTSVRLIREFLVAELKKSTRHLYTPPSWSCTFLICSRAFLLLLSSIAKNRRSPKSFAMAECVPNLTFLSRESMLCCGWNTKWIFILFIPHAVVCTWWCFHHSRYNHTRWKVFYSRIYCVSSHLCDSKIHNKMLIDLSCH